MDPITPRRVGSSGSTRRNSRARAASFRRRTGRNSGNHDRATRTTQSKHSAPTAGGAELNEAENGWPRSASGSALDRHTGAGRDVDAPGVAQEHQADDQRHHRDPDRVDQGLEPAHAPDQENRTDDDPRDERGPHLRVGQHDALAWLGCGTQACCVPPGMLERDDFSSNRHPALGYCWNMIFSENRYPLFGIMLWPAMVAD